jgi:hypothetical protein
MLSHEVAKYTSDGRSPSKNTVISEGLHGRYKNAWQFIPLLAL